ncbi:putative lipid II flippase FtsW [Cumulibacter soli]|uniref:putative lipid II flippase FtsW n=1 Tax=Cumulibacter soli TaxID=2546344 RepID=UPI0010675A66|nr:putative lipid II flippase FtsW [Cumulibacter soli]
MVSTESVERSARGSVVYESGQVARRYRNSIGAFLTKPMTSFYLVLVLTLALVSFGLVMMASASAVDSLQLYGSAYYLFNRQLIFVALGLIAMIAALRVPLGAWRRLSPMMMLAALMLLALVLVPGIGQELGGARRWFDIAGIMLFQPSEVGKIAFLLWGAHVLTQRRKILNTWGGMLKPLLPGLIVLCGLVVIEPDLHTTVTYIVIFLSLLWIAGAPMRMFGLMLIAGAAVGVAAIATQGFRMSRVLSFLDPWADADGSGHQAIQGFYALSTGGMFGVGLGNSRTKWGALPNAHSDYIFAIIGEELGFLGCALVLILFGGVAYAGIRIARRTGDVYIRLVSATTAVWMVAQALINVGYVVGLLPVTGITLPLISSGGTSLVVTMFAMGILASCARHEPPAIRYLQSRERRFGRWLSLPVPASVTVDVGKPPSGRARGGTRASATGGSTKKRAPKTKTAAAPKARTSANPRTAKAEPAKRARSATNPPTKRSPQAKRSRGDTGRTPPAGRTGTGARRASPDRGRNRTENHSRGRRTR